MSDEQIAFPDTLFISHASKDKEYVTELMNVLTMLGIPNVVCSSLERYQIPTGEDIYDYLKRQLIGSTRVLFILSENFYRSAACLNEMGACWALDKNYFTILTPNFKFEQISGAINANQLSFKLNDKSRLLGLVDRLQEEFKVQRKIPPFNLVEIIEQVTERINSIAYDEEIDSNRIHAKIESYKIDNENNKLLLAVRIINPTLENFSIDSVLFDLKDSLGNTLSGEVRGQKIIYTKENKIVHFDLDYEESDYSIYEQPLEEHIHLKAHIDRFPN